MKVLLNDGLEKEGIAIFQQAGIETDNKKRDPAQLLADIGQFDALVVRSATKVTREVIEAGAKGKLKIIGRARRRIRQHRCKSSIGKWYRR